VLGFFHVSEVTAEMNDAGQIRFIEENAPL
jgi:hypothetical protein